ncbi:MAG: fibronectin type III domain-containing protein, partial [Patescibacteria group bacterium]
SVDEKGVYTKIPNAGVKVTMTSQTSATITGLDNPYYYFRAVGYNDAGEGVQSDSVPIRPGQPGAISIVSVGDKRVTLSWVAPVWGGKPTGHYIYYKINTSTGTFLKLPKSVTVKITGTTAVIDGLVNGTKYYFKVVGYNTTTGGNSHPSPVAIPNVPIVSDSAKATPKIISIVAPLTLPQVISALNTSFSAAFAPISNLTISAFNSTVQSKIANFSGGGSLEVTFPKEALYSDTTCPPSLSTCAGLNLLKPAIGFRAMSSDDASNTGLQGVLAKIPTGLSLVASYPFYLEVVAQYPKTTTGTTQGNISILKSPISIQLTVDNFNTGEWKETGLYQYNPVSALWTKISLGLSQPFSGSINLNATTIPQDPGYLFAILGKK